MNDYKRGDAEGYFIFLPFMTFVTLLGCVRYVVGILAIDGVVG